MTICDGYMKDENQKLQVFQRGSVYLATKKIGKCNPKASEIEANNRKRQEWNRAVDMALISGIPEPQIMEVKQKRISEPIKSAISRKGRKPNLFAKVVTMAIEALELMIESVLVKKYKESLEQKEELQKTDVSEMRTVMPETGRTEAEINEPVERLPEPKQPEMTRMASKYPRFYKIYNELEQQNNAIYKKEKQRSAAINKIGDSWIQEDSKEPTTLMEWESLVPKMDIWLDVERDEIHYVANIIPTLKWRGGKLGTRLAFLPKDISKLFADYREEYFAARRAETAKKNVEIRLYPKNLCEFLEKNLNAYFSIKTYILDAAREETEIPQETPFEMECFIDNPLKRIIKVDMIDAQRGFADPDNTEGTTKSQKQLSEQMRDYYEKHLDPEKSPSSEDLDILQAAEQARQVFDKNLIIKFAPAIRELEELGYPGIADPKLTIATKMVMGETLKHDAAVQYTLSRSDTTLKLPEKYNGLGYQNLISMVFDLMRFRDDWMHEGKAKQIKKTSGLVIEPLHIVLIEEPEAHLHSSCISSL